VLDTSSTSFNLAEEFPHLWLLAVWCNYRYTFSYKINLPNRRKALHRMLGAADRPDLLEPYLLQQDLLILHAEKTFLTAQLTCECLSHILGDFVKHHPQSLGVVHSDYIFFG
jgi:hypothetical protein